MKNFTAYIERDEDGLYVGSVPALPGCYTQGATLQELVENLKEVVTLCARNIDAGEVTQFVGVQTIEVAV
jgi:predicted RNase H-like HicB family nuclease